MSEILSQSEIEALLSSLGSDGGAAGGGAPAAGGGAGPALGGFSGFGGQQGSQSSNQRQKRSSVAYEVYDFRRPDKFSKDQLRTLQMLHETFARLASSGLSAYLRAPVSIDLISLEQVPYEEYLRSISQSVFAIMSLPPLSGQAVFEIEFSLVFTMLDRMLGGPGRAISRGVLTDIERPLVRQTLEHMFTALKTAWEGVVIVNPNIETLETSAQFVQIAPPNDIVVTILFEVKIGNTRCAMSLCIPYLVLKPITAKLSAQKWFASGTRKQNPKTRRMITHNLGMTKIECCVELGHAQVTVDEFLHLKPGDLLTLDQRTSDQLTMMVAGVPKYMGKPALQGKNLIFSVTDAIEE